MKERKRRALSIGVCAAMLCIALVGGTMAYLTDTDAQANTFTSGNVKIDLWEDFGDNSGIENLIPATGSAQDGSLQGGVEKEVYVTNTGVEDAYTRVHIAIPSVLDNDDASQNVLHFNYAGDSIGEGKWDWSKTAGDAYTGDWNTYGVDIDGILYNVYVVTYGSALHSGDTTVDAISQVYLDSKVTNEKIEEIKMTLGDNWKIYVAAEACQANGFANAYEALNTAFGTPGDYDVDWKTATGKTFENVTNVSTASELAEALAAGGHVELDADIEINADETVTIASGVTASIDLNGHTISGSASKSGNEEMFLVKGTLNVTNGAITMTSSNNQGWNAMSTVFDVTGGGILNLNNAVVKNLGGTDMAYCVHLNNWGEVTLNANHSTLESTYIPVRVFNSGNDMNNVTIKNSNLVDTGDGSVALWIHNYTATDFGGSAEKAEAHAALLNFNIDGSNSFTGKISYGFSDEGSYKLTLEEYLAQ